MIRFFDILLSSVGLFFLSPLLTLLLIGIYLEDGGHPIFKQNRVGINGKEFSVLKLRSMKVSNDGLLLSTSNDSRITKIGRFIRKYKLDELPQLINVLKGDMSLVGPRPEVRKYTNLYNTDQLEVLKVKPGITDYASIVYRDENIILSKSKEPEVTYVTYVLPRKLRLNLIWVKNKSIRTYFDCIIRTILSIILSK